MTAEAPFSIRLQINKSDNNLRKQQDNRNLISYRFEDNSMIEFLKGFQLKESFGTNIEQEVDKIISNSIKSETITKESFYPTFVSQSGDGNDSVVKDILSLDSRLPKLTFLVITPNFTVENEVSNVSYDLDIYEHDNGISSEYLNDYTAKYSFNICIEAQLTLLACLLDKYYRSFANWVKDKTEFKYYEVIPYAAYPKFAILEATLALLDKNIPTKLRWLNLGASNLRKIRAELLTSMTFPSEVHKTEVSCFNYNNGNTVRRVVKYTGMDGKSTNLPRITLRSSRVVTEETVWSNASLQLE